MVFFLWVVLFSTPALGCQLLVRFDYYPPQAYMDENKQWQGMDVELSKALLDRVGCDYRFIRLPWGRALDKLAKGQIDMMSGVLKTPKRQKFAYFVGPQRQENMMLVSLASNPITLERLYNIGTLNTPIGIQRGAYFGADFTNLMAADKQFKAHFLVLPNHKMKLSLLQKGRVSGFVEEKVNVLFELKKTPLFRRSELHLATVNVSPVYFALSRVSVTPALLVKLREAFEMLQQNKTLAIITHKYAQE